MNDIFRKNPLTSLSGNLKGFVSANRCFAILLLFLAVIIVISFVIPFFDFGRLYGTDDYTHLYHTGVMAQTSSLTGFYDSMAGQVTDSAGGDNLYNYPFGLWVVGSEVAKMTGLDYITAAFVFTLIFAFVLIGSFYFYSGFILKSKEEKLLATLFFISMPNMALLMLAYRPSVFILPFLFLIVYIGYQDTVDWKMIPLMLFSIFIIVISHTGSFIFLVIFSVMFFLLYCLIGGKFSLPLYITIIGSFVIYVLSLSWFPEIANQYVADTALFQSTGNFLAGKLHIQIAGDLANALYQNLFVGQQLVYAILFAAIIFVVARILLFTHRQATMFIEEHEKKFPLALPITNISHSAISTPFWIGPIQSLFTLVGMLALDRKGKCFLFAALVCTVLPDLLQNAQGVTSDTGALRQVSFLVIIIPITATLGFIALIRWLRESTLSRKNLMSFAVWGLVLSSMIITPTIATTYYLPKIAGEDYVINGMKWLGQTGSSHDVAVGYGYRPVPIYTNMTDAAYDLQSGTDTRTFKNLLVSIYSTNNTQSPDDFQSLYAAKYIMSSNKILLNLGVTPQNLTIDNNPALDKIYASNDFGVYEVTSRPGSTIAKKLIAENVTLENIGSSLEINSPVYRLSLNGRAPIIDSIGTTQQNFLGQGYSGESIRIIENGTVSPVNDYTLATLNFTRTIAGNQITYRTVLQDVGNDTGSTAGQNLATLQVVYRFYPDMIQRTYLISNDWQEPVPTGEKTVLFSTDLFTPLSEFNVSDGQGREERHIYESDDTVTKNGLFQDLYIHSGDSGLFLRFDPSYPLPSSMTYRGSTVYDNMSSLSISNTETLKPGASMHVTQFISVGSEEGAAQNIAEYQGIRLLNYPSGITPIILTGMRTPASDVMDGGSIFDGYTTLSDNGIPFTESVSIPAAPASPDTTTSTDNNADALTSESDNGSTDQNTPGPVFPPVDLRNISTYGIKNVVGIQKTGVNSYDDYDTQNSNIGAVVSYAGDQGVTLAGFMPGSLDYDLDTVKILSDDQIPFAYALPASAPYTGIPDTGERIPELAYYQGTPTGVVLLPVSYPMSPTLLYQPDKDAVFSSWAETIDRAAKSGELVLFVFRANDIGNPAFTDDFVNLTNHAKDMGLTFTTPDVIADHFQKLQKVEYTGSINNDVAVIQARNNNPDTVSDVAFSVSMPALKDGGYTAINATVVRNSTEGSEETLFVSTDLPPSEVKTIVIQPAQKRKDMVVGIPVMPIMGRQTFIINDTAGAPLANVDVVVDSKHYRTDNAGLLTLTLTRGSHSLLVQSPGYNTVRKTIQVNGRIILLERFIHTLKL